MFLRFDSTCSGLAKPLGNNESSHADSAAQSSQFFHRLCPNSGAERPARKGRYSGARWLGKEQWRQRPTMKDSPLGTFRSADTRGRRKENARGPPVAGFAENPQLRARFLSRPCRRTCDPTSAMCKNPKEIVSVFFNNDNSLRFKRGLLRILRRE